MRAESDESVLAELQRGQADGEMKTRLCVVKKVGCRCIGKVGCVGTA